MYTGLKVPWNDNNTCIQVWRHHEMLTIHVYRFEGAMKCEQFMYTGLKVPWNVNNTCIQVWRHHEMLTIHVYRFEGTMKW